MYVQTPLGMRNMVNDQERMNFQAQQANTDRGHDMNKLAFMQAMEQAKIASNERMHGATIADRANDRSLQRDLSGTFADRSAAAASEAALGREHDASMRGTFDQRAGMQRELAQMDPSYIRAMLEQRQYSDNDWRRNLQRDLATQHTADMDPMGAMAFAFGDGGSYMNYRAGQDRAATARDDRLAQLRMAFLDSLKGTPQGRAAAGMMAEELGFDPRLIQTRGIDDMQQSMADVDTVTKHPAIAGKLERLIETFSDVDFAFTEDVMQMLANEKASILNDARQLGLTPDAISMLNEKIDQTIENNRRGVFISPFGTDAAVDMLRGIR